MAGMLLFPLILRVACTLLVLLSGAAVLSPARAQTGGHDSLPVLFDARERLPAPDLADLGRLRFVTTVDFPPFNFLDQTGRLSGLQVDLVRLICAELKISEKCQIQALPFAEIEAALESGQVDAAIAGHAATAALRARFAFSRPFMMLPARFAVNRKAMPDGAISALDGRAVGIVAGTTQAEMLRSWFPAIKPAEFESRTAMLAALKDGKVDAVFADGVQLVFWTASPASDGCCAMFGGAYFSEEAMGEGLSVMLRRKDASLAAAIDHALLMLSRDGRLQEAYLRYFPDGLY